MYSVVKNRIKLHGYGGRKFGALKIFSETSGPISTKRSHYQRSDLHFRLYQRCCSSCEDSQADLSLYFSYAFLTIGLTTSKRWNEVGAMR